MVVFIPGSLYTKMGFFVAAYSQALTEKVLSSYRKTVSQTEMRLRYRQYCLILNSCAVVNLDTAVAASGIEKYGITTVPP